MRPDGSDRKVIVADCRMPDGIAIDVAAGHIYWTNMGSAQRERRLHRARRSRRAGIAGSSFPRAPRSRRSRSSSTRRTASCTGATAKGCASCAQSRRVEIETLVETGRGDADRRDQTRWCVGITIDPEREQIYWTQKGPDDAGPGRIFRAGHRNPKGPDRRQPHRHRSLFDHLPEPIDLELDLKNASCTGPIAATRRAATRSTARPMDAKARARRRSCSPI